MFKEFNQTKNSGPLVQLQQHNWQSPITTSSGCSRWASCGTALVALWAKHESSSCGHSGRASYGGQICGSAHPRSSAQGGSRLPPLRIQPLPPTQQHLIPTGLTWPVLELSPLAGATGVGIDCRLWKGNQQPFLLESLTAEREEGLLWGSRGHDLLWWSANQHWPMLSGAISCLQADWISERPL